MMAEAEADIVKGTSGSQAAKQPIPIKKDAVLPTAGLQVLVRERLTCVRHHVLSCAGH